MAPSIGDCWKYRQKRRRNSNCCIPAMLPENRGPSFYGENAVNKSCNFAWTMFFSRRKMTMLGVFGDDM